MSIHNKIFFLNALKNGLGAALETHSVTFLIKLLSQKPSTFDSEQWSISYHEHWLIATGQNFHQERNVLSFGIIKYCTG